MTAGYEWGNQGTGGAMRTSADPVQYVLDRSMIQTPGSVYNYGDGAPFLLGAIISKATGMSTLEFATEYLFDPLNITDIRWERNGEQYFTASGLHLLPRDMAKIGYLFLNNGRWGEEQIISPEWITESTQTHVSGPGFMAGDPFEVDGYGYLWWTFPDCGIYYASGMYEQRIYVCPELDLVVVFTSSNYGAEVTPRLLFQYILPACEEYTASRYSKYGVSFSYPIGMKLVEASSPYGGEVVSEESGFVQAYFKHPSQSVSMMWYPGSEEMGIEEEMNKLFSMIESDTTVIDRGSTDIKEFGGRTVLYLSANVTENGYTTSGLIGGWFNRDTQRIVLTYYIADPSFFTQREIKTTFINHLESFR
jgi:CubicO group peptidase (beta-lactamase class C family)